MGGTLKDIGNFAGDVWGSALDPFGTVTGKNALERTGMFNVPKGETIAGIGQAGPTKLWSPQSPASIALSQPKAKKPGQVKQTLGKVTTDGS